MKWIRMLLVGLLLLGSAGSAMAQAIFDSEVPGSVLVFPKFITGPAGVNGPPKSSFEISVTCPNGATCPEFTDAVKLKALWVCPGSQNPSAKRICKATDFELFTTVKGTLWFNPDNNPLALSPGGTGAPNAGANIQTPFVPAPPCARGYLIVYVINNLDQPLSFNGLIGNAIIRFGENDASAYNAIPIQSPAPARTILSTNPNDNLRFDGTMYAQVAGRIFGTVRYEKTGTGEIQTSLTLLTLDVRANTSNLPTFIPLTAYNENERVISSSFEFLCWTEKRLKDINANYNQNFGGLLARKGLIETDIRATQQNTDLPFNTFDATLLGLIETKEWNKNAVGNPDRSYMYGLFHDGIGVTTRFCPFAGSPCPVP